MSQITGKYQYVSGENFEEFIKKIIGKPELVGILLEAAPAIEFQQNGDQWIVTIGNKDKIVTSTFKLGEPYDEQLPSANLVLKSVTTREGNKLRTESSLSADISVIRIYEFTEDGMSACWSSKKCDIRAKRMYKRL